MPLYDFSDGKHNFDSIVPFDTEKTKCPECGKVAKRAYGGPVNLTHRMNTKEGGTRSISKPKPKFID